MPENVLHVAGLILARGGSQGIPLKNITKLHSKPLLAWSLGAMKHFGRFDSLWVSTDHALIAQCASSMGASVFHRSPKYAKCGTPSLDAVQEFLDEHLEVDIVGLVQCTSPFLQPEYLSKAYDLMIKEGYDSVFSVTRDKKLRWSEEDFDTQEDNDPKSDSIPLLPLKGCDIEHCKSTTIEKDDVAAAMEDLNPTKICDKINSFCESCAPSESTSSLSSCSSPSTNAHQEEEILKKNRKNLLDTNLQQKQQNQNGSEHFTVSSSEAYLDSTKIIQVNLVKPLSNPNSGGEEVILINHCQNKAHNATEYVRDAGSEDSANNRTLFDSYSR